MVIENKDKIAYVVDIETGEIIDAITIGDMIIHKQINEYSNSYINIFDKR